MKKLILISIVCLMTFSSQAWANDFINGGFESGDLSGWTGGGGYWGSNVGPIYVPYTGGALPTATQYNGGTPNNTIMSGGTDPITGANRVYNGSYSVRVNDSVNNYSASTIRQSVTGYSNPGIFFAWNAVLESSHGLTDSDYFSLTLRDDTAGTDLVNRGYSSAGSIGGGTSGVTWTPFGGWYSSGWVVESIDVAALGAVGHDFTLSLLGSDCPYSGHAGYVYLDGFGAAPPQPGAIPEPATMFLLGSGLVGLAGYARKRFKK